MEFCIVKVLDGIFLSNRSILTDYQFIFNNKISHIISWLAPLGSINPNTYQYCPGVQDPSCFQNEMEAPDTIRSMGVHLSMMNRQDSVPTCSQIKQCEKCINESKQQCLCCLIVADNLLDGVWLIVPYLSLKFGWSLETSLSLVIKKLSDSGFLELQTVTDQIIKGLSPLYSWSNNQNSGIDSPMDKVKQINKGLLNNESEVAIFLDENQQQSEIQFLKVSKSHLFSQQINLSNAKKNIDWKSYEFLKNYQTQDVDELLIINTIKNINLCKEKQIFEEAKLSQKNISKKRIKWTDQASTMQGQRMFGNSRINTSLKKGNSYNNLNNRTLGNPQPPIGFGIYTEKIKANNSSSPAYLKPLLKNCTSQLDFDIKFQSEKTVQDSNSESQTIKNNFTQNSVPFSGPLSLNVSKKLHHRNITSATKNNRRLSNKKQNSKALSQDKKNTLKENTLLSLFDDFDQESKQITLRKIPSKGNNNEGKQFGTNSRIKGYKKKVLKENKYQNNRPFKLNIKPDTISSNNLNLLVKNKKNYLGQKDDIQNFFQSLVNSNIRKKSNAQTGIPINSMKNWNSVLKCKNR